MHSFPFARRTRLLHMLTDCCAFSPMNERKCSDSICLPLGRLCAVLLSLMHLSHACKVSRAQQLPDYPVRLPSFNSKVSLMRRTKIRAIKSVLLASVMEIGKFE